MSISTVKCGAHGLHSAASRRRLSESAEAEAVVVDQPWNDAAVERVQAILDRTLQPMSDHRGSKEYRLEVSKSLVEKFQWEHAL